MKKYILKINLLLLILVTFSFSGCILDAFDSIPLNIPLSFEIDVQGTADNLSGSSSFCLSDSKLYNDYKSKINQINLLEITFRPTEASPSNLSADINLIIKKNDGSVLINQTLSNITPANYIAPNAPYVLEVPQAQLQLMDAYLNASGNCFSAEVSINNIQPSTGTKTLKATVEMVFKTDTEL